MVLRSQSAKDARQSLEAQLASQAQTLTQVQQRLAQETSAKEAEHKERLQTLEKLQAATAAAAALQSDKGELAGQVAAAARTIDELHAAAKQREAQFAARDDAAGKAVRLLF